MTGPVLLVGTSAVLAARLAARLLAAGDADVVLVVTDLSGAGVARLRDVVLAADRPVATAVRLRCRTVAASELANALAAGLTAEPPAQVWCVAPGALLPPARAARRDATVARALLQAMPGLGASRYVHVGPAPGAAGPDDSPAARTYAALERETVERGVVTGVVWRVLRVPPVADPYAPQLGETLPGLHQLLTAVHSVKAEVAERDTAYLRTHPLQITGLRDHAIALLPAEAAAEALWRAGDLPGAADGFHTVAAPAPTPVADLLAAVAAAYGVELRQMPDRSEFTTVDRLLERRLDGLYEATAHGRERTAGPTRATPCPAATPSPAAAPSPAEVRDLIGAVRAAQDREHDARQARLAQPRRWLSARSVRVAGAPLTLYQGGEEGPSLVVLNALGQGEGFLTALLERLAERHRVVTWHVRGTDPDLPPVDLDGQLRDLAAVLEHAGVDRCHLVGWCTGAKIATEFQRRRPSAVASMVFLNGTFKQDGHWTGLDVGYERNLEALCRAVDRDPATAARLAGLFALGTDEPKPGEPHAAASVLGVLSPALREEVRGPFRSPETLARYARQLVGLWTLDTARAAPHVDVDVLFVGAECDGVSAPERAKAAAAAFPRARYAELALATHYVPHDRAGLVARLIADFVRAPDDETLTVEHGEVRWIRSTKEAP